MRRVAKGQTLWQKAGRKNYSIMRRSLQRQPGRPGSSITIDVEEITTARALGYEKRDLPKASRTWAQGRLERYEQRSGQPVS